MKKVKVYGTRVSILEDAGVRETHGLIVPDSVNVNEITGLQKHIKTGTVGSFGQECVFVEEGMRVLYGRGDLTEVSISPTEKFSILREKTILFSFTEAGIDRVNDDRVVIKPEPKDKTTAGGLIIPDNVAHRATKGDIVQVGKACKWAEKGITVLFGNAAGTEVSFMGKDYIVVREADLIGPWEEEN